MHGKEIGLIAVADARVEHRDGVGFPGQTQVAFVGDDDSVALSCPIHDLAKVVDTEHLAGRIGRRVDEDQRGAFGAETIQSVCTKNSCTGEQRTHFVCGIRQFGDDDKIIGTQTQQTRQPGDHFLGADGRKHRVGRDTGDRVATFERRHRGLPQRGGTDGRRVTGLVGHRVQRDPNHLGDRVDGRADRQIHDAVRVRRRLLLGSGQRVPRKVGQRRCHRSACQGVSSRPWEAEP
ncbi:unannotated protein [freshwater metagenome]|uniref:Unannotated protein n=1 Tax=freshwater metagenome TaxID=449393 RepID=A0A6J7IT31_9ZZZZ